MSVTQVDINNIDARAMIASFKGNMSAGAAELLLFASSDTDLGRDEHLNKAKQCFIRAARNAQGVINPRTKERIMFNDTNMVNGAVDGLCRTLKMSAMAKWADGAPILNITDTYPYNPMKRHDYDATKEYSLIDEVDCKGLAFEKKQEIAKQICKCISVLFVDYNPSQLRKREMDSLHIKALETFVKLAWHYGLTEEKDSVMKVLLEADGLELKGINQLSLEKLIYRQS